MKKNEVDIDERVADRSAVSKEKRRARQRRENQRANQRPRLGCLGVLSLILAVMIIFMSLYLLFRIQKFEVRGNEYSASTETVNWIKEDEWATNSLYLWGKFLVAKPEVPAYAKDVKVSIRSPWTVRVNVIEREPIAGVEMIDSYMYFDVDGVVMTKTPTKIEGLPLVIGMEIPDTNLYEKLQVSDVDIFANILEITKLLEAHKLEPDKIINRSEDELDLLFGTIMVQLGSGDYEEKVLQVEPMLQKLEGQEGELDLKSFSESNQVSNFRKKTLENE